jgi:hypothetical protein
VPWYRGNLHAHTTNSDGDSPPDAVVAWYRDAGYDFLALTDHDLLTLPADHRAAAGPMLLVHGEEVSAGDIHVNALGIRATVPPAIGGSAAQTLQRNVDAIRAAGGVPAVNHPNFRWQLRPADLLALRGCRLLEVHNAGPETNNGGRPGHPSAEAIWDLLLDEGRLVFGIAVDDAHHFRTWGRERSNPGRAWVRVRAPRVDEPSILGALEAGDFHATTGVALAEVRASASELAIEVAQRADVAYRTTFIGPGGVTLDVVDGPEPRHRLRGRERRVRARVEDSDGLVAWVQPLVR